MSYYGVVCRSVEADRLLLLLLEGPKSFVNRFLELCALRVDVRSLDFDLRLDFFSLAGESRFDVNKFLEL